MGSEEDLRRPEMSRSCEPASGLHLLAENFKKLEQKEREREKKSRGSGWGNLGDKLKSAQKSARRSSKKISSFAAAKFGEGQEQIRRRLKRGSKDAPSPLVSREVVSDTEEDNLSSHSTPLLFSMSASTQNLSSSSLQSASNRPPPKPPRTFKTKDLHDMPSESPDGEGEGEEIFNGEFSDVLSAIKEMGVAITGGKSLEGVANGCIPAPGNGRSKEAPDSIPSSSGGSASFLITRSESSPQLSHISPTGDIEQNPPELSPRLQTISEDTDDPSSPQPSPLSAVEGDSDKTDSPVPPVPGGEGSDEDWAVTLRRSTEPPMSLDEDFVTLRRNTEPPTSLSEGVTLRKKVDMPTSDTEGGTLSLPRPQDSDPILQKRYSILSTTSAEFFSAESSEGEEDGCGSRPGSSPDFVVGGGAGGSLPMPLPITSPIQTPVDGNSRAISSLSIEDDFNTPPSSPYSSTTPSPDAKSTAVRVATNHVSQLDHVTQPGHFVLSDQSMTATPTSPFSSSGTPSPSTERKWNAQQRARREGEGVADTATPTTTSTGEVGRVETDGVHISVVEGTDETTGDGKGVLPSALDVQKMKLADSIEEPATPTVTTPTIATPTTTMSSVVSPTHTSDDVATPTHATSNMSTPTVVTPTHTTSNVATPTATTASPVRQVRDRCNTTLSESGTLPLRGKKAKLSTLKSRDDNFGTEFKETASEWMTNSDGLVSYFSQKDLEDIFKTSSGKPLKIDTVKEEEEGQEGAGQEEGGIEISLEAGNVAEKEKEEGEVAEEAKAGDEEVKSADQASSVSPESLVITPTIIPDDVTPRMVKGNQYHKHMSCVTVFLLSSSCSTLCVRRTYPVFSVHWLMAAMSTTLTRTMGQRHQCFRQWKW